MKILGFDLGDGESAVTLLDEDSTIEPRVLPICGQRSVLTAVGTRDGRIVIGEDASVMSGAMDVQVRFKAKYLTDPSTAGVVRMFAQGVLSQLLQSEPALMASVTSTVVGCPAGWGEGRRQQYAALMESAGFPNVQVVPEPRAAFLYARHARGLRVDPALMKHSALVIDIGSSTTDFAYIVNGRQQNLSLFGDTNLGGGLLDELILRHAIDTSPDKKALSRAMEESPAWCSYCELQARRLKESYFLSEEKWQETPLTKQIVVCYDETLLLELRIGGGDVEQMIREPIAALGGRSFMTCLQDSLRAASEFSRSCPPQAIILTGGASRMDFFRDAVCAAFPKSLLVICPEPECSIARGLAYAGCVDERLKIFREEVASITRGDALREVVSAQAHKLYAPLAGAVYAIARDCVLNAVKLWRQGGLDTIEALERAAEENIREAIAGEALMQAVKAPMRAWMEGVMLALEEELKNLCARCGVPQERMSLTDTRIKTGLDGVNVSLMDAMGMDVFSGLMGVAMAAVGAAVCGGGGVALLGSGPLGMMLGAAIGILVALLGKNGMEHAMRRMKFPLIMRLLVTDGAVRLGLERQREKIESAVVSALADPRSGFEAEICRTLSHTLGAQLEAMAKNAEMSIEA